MNESEFCYKCQINDVYFLIVIVMGFLYLGRLLYVYFNLYRTFQDFWLYIRNNQRDSRDIIFIQNANDSNNCSGKTFMLRINYDELVSATDNWNQNRVLGEGGFGVVYKGNWKHTDVAIKRLKAEFGVTLPLFLYHTNKFSLYFLRFRE